MANPIVELEEDFIDTDSAKLTESLSQEREPENEVITEIANNVKKEEAQLPPKFEGKNVDEIVKSYANLEQQFGRQGSELGELRKLADSLIQKNLQDTSNTRSESLEKSISEDDFYSDPVNAVRKVVEEALEPMKSNLSQTKVDSTVQRLQAKHPDMADVVNDLGFQQWIMETTPRQDMWVKASNGDFEYADELFTQYKGNNTSQVQAQKEQKQVVKSKELEDASSVSSGASQDAGGSSGKTIYRRSELIRLKMNDPTRYSDLHGEIMQAYAEGRVR
jgi:hypothetical protein|tara:strand:- start:6347 stop:7177 length:831 start_codon:yes stop_codon:yes gene_type:complete